MSMQALDDLSLDVPDAVTMTGHFVVTAMTDGILPASFLNHIPSRACCPSTFHMNVFYIHLKTKNKMFINMYIII